MLHKTRFLLIFIMVLAVGLAISLLGSPTAKVVKAAGPSNLVVTAVAPTVAFDEEGVGNAFSIHVQETAGVAADPPTAANSIAGFNIPANQHAVAFNLPVGIRFASLNAGTSNFTSCTAGVLAANQLQPVVCLYGAPS